MGFREGELVIYKPQYMKQGLPMPDVEAKILAKPAQGKVQILCKAGTEFVIKRTVSVQNVRAISEHR